ncbi:MAG: hypothetical protein WAP55_02275 [Minisyncoccia bacterium]
MVAILGVVVALFYFLPPFLIWKNFNHSDSSFVLAQLETYKDELKDYLPRAHEVYDGHFPPQDAYFNEQRPTVLNHLPPLVFSAFFFLWNGDTNLAYLSAQFLFSIVIFAGLYLLSKIFFESLNWRLFFAFSGSLTPLAFWFYRWGVDDMNLNGIIGFLSVVVKQFVPLVDTPVHKLYLARIDDPLLTLPFLIASFGFLFKFWFKPLKIYAVLAGVASGFLFYTYFHYWVYVTLVIGMLFLYSVYDRNNNRERFFNFILLGISLILVTLPYAFNYFQTSQLADYKDFVYRYGVAEGRSLGIFTQFRWRYPVYIVLAVISYFLYRKREKDKMILFLICSAGMVLSGNLQFLTGFMPVPGQATKAAAFIVFFMLFVIFHDLLKKISTKILFKKIINLVVIFLVLVIPTKKIVNIIKLANPNEEVLKSYYFDSSVSSSWSWIDINLPHEPKLLSSSPVSSVYLASYTSSRPYLAAGFASAMPMARLEDRFLAANKFFDVTTEVFKNRLSEKEVTCTEPCPKDGWMNLNKSNRFLYINYFSKGKSVLKGDSFMSEDYLNKLTEKYKTLPMPTFGDLSADYVYYGPWEKQFSRPDFRSNKKLSSIYFSPNVSIYKINK